jgi:hypothetical protein
MKEIYDVGAVAVDLPGVYDEVGRHALMMTILPPSSG